MAYPHQQFYTNGSNALKADNASYDVFIKPSFLPEENETPIIDFKEAQHTVQYSQLQPSSQLPTERLGASLVRIVKHNRLLGDLFRPHEQNIYRQEDIRVFAKGFSATGLVAFILILFGA